MRPKAQRHAKVSTINNEGEQMGIRLFGGNVIPHNVFLKILAHIQAPALGFDVVSCGALHVLHSYQICIDEASCSSKTGALRVGSIGRTRLLEVSWCVLCRSCARHGLRPHRRHRCTICLVSSPKRHLSPFCYRSCTFTHHPTLCTMIQPSASMRGSDLIQPDLCFAAAGLKATQVFSR